MPEISTQDRVREQARLSEALYDAVDQHKDGEVTHRLILRDCLGTLAVALEHSHDYGYAGDATHRRMLDHLADHGLTTDAAAYDPYPEYRNYAAVVRSVRPRLFAAPSPQLADVFATYGDVERATRDRANRKETDSRHVVHVAAMAVPYALREYPDLDVSRVSSYVFVHDIVEWYAGDTASLKMSPEVEARKQAIEEEGLELFGQTFSTEYPKLVRLVEDYEKLVDDEAKFVKTFEKLDPGFTHFANAGQVIKELGITTPTEFWQAHHNTYVRMSRYALGFPKILEDRDMRAGLIAQVTWPDTV